jgi:site-specific DNA recombinase
MRIATYTRISTDEDRQPFSLGAQAERLEAYARSQDGWGIVRRFTDQASGATLDRPGLRQALSEAAAGVYELLLVYRVDRLSRSVRQLAEIGENLDHFGVSLRSATEPFDTSTAAGKMMLQMLAVFAEFERTTIVERITAGMERAAAEGRWIVGSTPFAYLRDRDNKQIVPDPARVDVVRRIFRMYAEERMGAEAIAQVLNAEGHRSKNGVPFARPNVLWILRNPAYVGKVAFRGRVHPGRHEPLVDERTFEAVQAILAERGESQALKRGHPSDYMLSGVLRCGRCRKAYVGTAAHGRNTRYRYYVCSTRYRYGTKTCDGDRLPMEALEDAVVEQMAKVFGDTALVGKAIAVSRAEEATASDEVARRLASTQQQLAGARRSLDRYFAAFEEGIMSAADCRERVDRLRKRIEALEAEERATADAGPDSLSMAPTVDDVAEWARDLRRLFESATAQQKKAVIRLLVKELRVMSRKDIRPTYKIPALVRAPDSQVVPTGFEPVSPP